MTQLVGLSEQLVKSLLNVMTNTINHLVTLLLSSVSRRQDGTQSQ
jgi:hypothetical protein